MIKEIKKDAKSRMTKSVDALRNELAKLRASRAHTSLLDHITVSYYGTEVPIGQAANVGVADARTLTVSPWEKKMVPEIEKAIRNSDLGLNPVTAGEVIRVPLPALTEERRRELTRVVRHEAETARVAIRNIRRDANHALKAAIKDKTLTEDQEHRGEEEIQKLTDEFIARVDEVAKQKEADLMEV